jgi:hypothetical protein
MALLDEGIELLESIVDGARSGRVHELDMFDLDLALGAIRARLPRGTADPGFDGARAVLRPREHLADPLARRLRPDWEPAIERIVAATEVLRRTRLLKASRNRRPI